MGGEDIGLEAEHCRESLHCLAQSSTESKPCEDMSGTLAGPVVSWEGSWAQGRQQA